MDLRLCSLGAASGIGRAIAERLAKAGAAVTVLDLNGDAAKEVAEKIGGEAMEADLLEKINELVDKLGEGENQEDKRLRLPGEERKEYKHIEVRWADISTEMLQTLSRLCVEARSQPIIYTKTNEPR